jgi:multidrug efflux pump
MKLSDISIRRPVLASMMSLALVLFGAISFTRLTVREFPDVDQPIISVQTVLPGANPRVVESSVTDILEEELATVEGLRTLTSSSSEQSSNITLEFNLDRDVESAAQDVRDKVSRVRGRLPREVLEPVVGVLNRIIAIAPKTPSPRARLSPTAIITIAVTMAPKISAWKKFLG